MMPGRSVRYRAPKASSPRVRHLMQSVRQTGTKPENHIHEELLSKGLQPNTATRPIPEIRVTADLVFPSVKCKRRR